MTYTNNCCGTCASNKDNSILNIWYTDDEHAIDRTESKKNRATSTKALGFKTIKPKFFSVTMKNNGKTYNLKQFLTSEERLDVTSNILSAVSVYNTELNFLNVLQLEIFKGLYLTEAYTNIKLTEDQWDNPVETFDLLDKNGILRIISEADDYFKVSTEIELAAQELYNYKNSAMGIMDNIQNNYKDTNLAIDEVLNKVSDPNAMSFVKEVMEKMG